MFFSSFCARSDWSTSFLRFFVCVCSDLLRSFVCKISSSKDAEDRLILAERIMEKHLDPGASKEINLSHETRIPLEALGAKLKRSLLSDCLPEVFAPAFNEVRTMVLLNVFPAYKKAAASQDDKPRFALFKKK